MRILLIDDRTDSSPVSRSVFTPPGMSMHRCAGMEDGIGSLRNSPGQFDLVLVDRHLGSERLEELLTAADQSGLRGGVLIMGPGPGVLDQLQFAASNVGRASDPASGCRLSPQEERAATFVMEGLSNKQIGNRMEVSESCVKGLLQRIFLKTGVRRRSQLVRLLMERRSRAASSSGND